MEPTRRTGQGWRMGLAALGAVVLFGLPSWAADAPGQPATSARQELTPEQMLHFTVAVKPERVRPGQTVTVTVAGILGEGCHAYGPSRRRCPSRRSRRPTRGKRSSSARAFTGACRCWLIETRCPVRCGCRSRSAPWCACDGCLPLAKKLEASFDVRPRSRRCRSIRSLPSVPAAACRRRR